MAYMNQEKKRFLAPQIKAVLKKYNAKGTIAVENYSTLVVNVASSPIDFDLDGREHKEFMYTHQCKSDVETAFISELLQAMNQCDECKNHDNSDSQTDYFDIGWFTHIRIGRWNKPYQVIS